MTDLLVVLAMAAVTYGCRVLFLVHPGRTPSGRLGLFLERFPLALFVALAAATLLLPEESVDPVPGYAALGRRGGRGPADPAVAAGGAGVRHSRLLAGAMAQSGEVGAPAGVRQPPRRPYP